MAELAQPIESLGPTPAAPIAYDAFLSYAHRDKQVTTAIQKGLHRIGCRFGRLRALRVFRDDTNLEAAPDLWARITAALDSSRFMIVVLSPQAAASKWVDKELAYWLEYRGHDKLMLVLAEGHLNWDVEHGRFDDSSDAAPPALKVPGSLRAEPLYIDVSGDSPWDLRSLSFRDKVTALAAPIHGKPKDQLEGDDQRERRRFRRLRAAAVAGLVMLTVTSVVFAVVAVAQRQQAEQHLHEAIAAKLNAEGSAILAGVAPGGDARGLQELLAANAIVPNPVSILNAQINRFTTQKIVDISSVPLDLAYSPDGSRVATAAVDGTVRQWDTVTGKPIGSPIKAHNGPATSVAFRSEHTIVSAGADGALRLWNADTGEARNQSPSNVGQLTSVAVSPDGSTIFTGGLDGNLRSWDARTGQLRGTRQVFVPKNPGDAAPPVTDVAFDRSGKVLAVSSMGATIISDAVTGAPRTPLMLMPLNNGLPTRVWQSAISPDGHAMVEAGGFLQWSNADTGSAIRAMPAGNVLLNYFGVAFSPDGHRIVTGRSDGAVQVWDTDTGVQVGPTLTGHTSEVHGVAFNPDGRQIATASADGTLRLWNATVGYPMKGPDRAATNVMFSPDGHRVAISGDTTVQRWDVGSGQPLPPLAPSGGPGVYFRYVDGGRIVTATRGGTLQVWDADTAQPLQQPVQTKGQEVDGLGIPFVFSRDGNMVASGQTSTGAVQLWDVRTGRALGKPMTADKQIFSVDFSPDARRIVAGYADGVRLWKLDTAQVDGPVMTTASPFPIATVAFSRDGKVIAAVHENGVIDLWDADTRKPLPHSPLLGHTSVVFGVAFGVGDQLATGGIDASLRLWETSTGKPAAAPLTTPDGIAGVALSPDGRLVAASNVDGTVRLWPAVADPAQLCDKLTSNMSRKQWRDWVSPDIGYIPACPGLPIAPD
ncbi:PQQ-binding-like beta-propeller repeat protein [Mycobacterium sp. OAE908]|uniref:outer membrane protein assembly factor BamB family protein n=1 Tax=Mycobacterium sp. OAE908 TaxID=2817899 RepID=UPI001AE2D757